MKKLNTVDVKEEKMPSLERKFADTTTLHAVLRIADKSKFSVLRVAWFLAFIACMVACIFNVYTQVHAFFQYEVNTKIERVYERPLEFPAVTICNFNRFRASETTKEDFPYIAFFIYDYPDYDDENIDPSYFDFDTHFGGSNYSFNYTEFTKRAGFILNEKTLLECSWRSRKCSAKNFTHVFTSFGNCYTFNSGKDEHGKTVPILKEDQPGSDNGLKVTIDIHQSEYSERADDGGNHQAGIKVLVHDQADPPLIDSLGSSVPPGTYAFMSVRREQYKNIGPPWGTCDKDKILKYFHKYTISGCLIECRLQHILRECHCRPVSYPGTQEVCSPRLTTICVRNVLQKLRKGILSECNCPVPCEYTQYSTSVSYGALPSESIANFWEYYWNTSYEYLRDNILEIDIYYEELNSETLSQKKALTVSDMISNIGGSLGLFLGGSLLTFAEIVEYIILKCMSPCRQKKKYEIKSTYPPVPMYEGNI